MENKNTWFAVAGQEFAIVDGEPLAFGKGVATIMNEGGPYNPSIEVDEDLVKWLKMKRAMLTTLIERMDQWVALADGAARKESVDREQRMVRRMNRLEERLGELEEQIEEEEEEEKKNPE